MLFEGPVLFSLLISGLNFQLNRSLVRWGKMMFYLFFQKTRGVRGPARAKAAAAAAKEEGEEERTAANQPKARGRRQQPPPTAKTRQVNSQIHRETMISNG